MIQAPTKSVSGCDHQLLESYFLQSTGENIGWELEDVDVEITKDNLNSSDVELLHHLHRKFLELCVISKSVDVYDIKIFVTGFQYGAMSRLKVVRTDWDCFCHQCNSFTSSMNIIVIKSVILILQVFFQPCFLNTNYITFV